MKLGKIVLSIALVVVGLGMYAGSTWSARQIGQWSWLADEEGITVVCPSATRLPSLWQTADGAAVVLYTVLGGGRHTWPGGKPMPGWRVGPTSDGIDATREMWAFFREHRLGRTATTTR